MPGENTDATLVRLRRIEEDLKELKAMIAELEDAVVANKVDVARLGERLTMFQFLQSAYTTAAAAIAAVFGRMLQS